VEDHDSGQGLCGIDRSRVESCAVDASYDIGGVIANVLWVAVILIGASRSNIENAVAECTKCDRGMADCRRVGERHLQDRNIANDRCRDGGDEE